MTTKTLTLKPMNDRVVIEPIAHEEKTAGGIFLPDSAQEKPMKGTVLAVGPGALTEDGKRIPMDVKAGDTVLYGKYAGTEVKVHGESYLIMQQREILGIFEA